MKSHTEYLTFNIPPHGVPEHHPAGRGAVRKSGVKEGSCLVNAMHITASVFINDDERGPAPGLTAVAGEAGPVRCLAEPLPAQPHRRGQRRRPLKRQVMGREVVVAITEGQLDFGPWEQIFYGEFDGRRPKRVLVKVIGE